MILLKYHLVRVVRMARLCYNPIRRRLLLVVRVTVSRYRSLAYFPSYDRGLPLVIYGLSVTA